jgi:crotonobetainyl-CoA:carnitine CoA-transferase CaiB-like acyl-CoA transferase
MKLEGLRVIDLSSFLPGPYLTMTLADHGAEVIKIEQPGEGDPGRHIGSSDGPCSVFFRNFNRGKKSVMLDLKSSDQREKLLTLCETADVFVETFRPGAADRLGVGYATVSMRNPRVVYCSISAFGARGAYGDRPAHDLALEAMSGVLGMMRGNDGQPVIPAIPIADQLSALQGLSAVLMALLRRESTGRGDRIDIAMHDATLAACANIVGPVLAENRQPVPKHERSTGGSAFYQVYETRDGRHIVLAGQEPKFVRNLLGALKRENLVPLCLRGPGPHQQPVIAFLAETFGKMSLDEAQAFLFRLDVCYGPLQTLPEAFEDANIRARGSILHDDLGRRHIAPVIRFLNEPAQPSLHAPALGEHNDAVLGLARENKPDAA